MGDTKKKIYDCLIEGATAGLTDEALYNFVARKVPKASSKRIVRAGFLALSDPALTDRNILNVIYALAIKHRLDGGGPEDDADGDTKVTEKAESAASVEKKRKK